MKRILVLLVIMALLCGCGGKTEATSSANSSEQVNQESKSDDIDSADGVETEDVTTNETMLWKVEAERDEFGDEKKDGEKILSTVAKGDFSNSATVSSELVVGVQMIMWEPENRVFSFTLLEYGDNPATFLASDPMSMKIKVDDTITDIGLETFNGVQGVYTEFSQGQKDGFYFYEYLRKGKDIRCIIEIGNSKYNFTIESSNFVEAYNEAFPDYAIAIKDDSESVSTSNIADAQVGDLISYGKTENGELISWRVLDKEDGKILVVSEDILLEKPLYSEFYSDLNWFNSPLSEWLNSEFIQSTFTEKEKEAILESEFEEKEESYSQKLFLLSQEEAEQYFADDNDRIAYTIDTKTPDAWRLRDGWIVDRSKYHYIILNYVKSNGEFESYPVHAGDLIYIRPAMWLNTIN